MRCPDFFVLSVNCSSIYKCIKWLYFFLIFFAVLVGNSYSNNSSQNVFDIDAVKELFTFDTNKQLEAKSKGVLAFLSLFSNDSDIYAVVTQSILSIRSGPSKRYPVINTALKGDYVKVTSHLTNWFRVIDQYGVEGWISFEDLSQLKNNEGYFLHIKGFALKEYTRNNFYFGSSFGFIDRSTLLGVALGYRIHPSFAIEAQLAKILSPYILSDLQQISLLIFLEQRDPKIDIYVKIGGGFIVNKNRKYLNRNLLSNTDIVGLGVGAKYRIYKNLFLGMELYRHKLLTLQKYSGIIEWNIKLTSYF